MKLSDSLLLRVAPPIGAAVIRLIARTMNIEHVDEPSWETEYTEKEGVIFAFWHNRLLLMPFAGRGRRVAALISRHRDGELISRTLDRFGLISVRGSTTRGGRTALRRLPDLLREGTDVAITPDGPTGPLYRAQPGAIQLARLSGRPVLPVTFASSRHRSISSWDRFQVPGFFARGAFLWGPPLTVGEDDDLEERRQALESALVEITNRADGYVRGGSEKTSAEASGKARS